MFHFVLSDTGQFHINWNKHPIHIYPQHISPKAATCKAKLETHFQLYVSNLTVILEMGQNIKFKTHFQLSVSNLTVILEMGQSH